MEGKAALLKPAFHRAKQNKTIFDVNLKQIRKHSLIINLVVFELGISGGYVFLMGCVYETDFSIS